MNFESRTAYFKAYYEANKDRLKARAKVRRQQKPEACAAVVRDWYSKEENKAKRREYFKAYCKTGPFKSAQRAYAMRNPGLQQSKVVARRAAKLKRTPKWTTRDDRNVMSALYQLAAVYSEALETEFDVDHVIPLQGRTVSGFHHPVNLQVITRADNRSKSNSF